MVPNVTPTESLNWTPLIRKSHDGDAPAVASLLDNSADHLDEDESGKTALHWAVVKGRVDVVQILLNHHTKWVSTHGHDVRGSLPIHMRTYEQIKSSTVSVITPLELAAESNNEAIFKILLDHFHHDPPSIRFNGLWTPSKPNDLPDDAPSHNECYFRVVAERSLGYRNQIRLTGLTGKAKTCAFLQQLPHIAIRDGKLSVLDMLLKQRADPNSRSESNQTPLHTAALYQSDPRYVRILLAGGADPLRIDHAAGLTALQFAICLGYEDVVSALLEGGASPNTVPGTHPKQAPLVLACYPILRRDEGLAPRLTRKLIEWGADVNAKDDQGHSVLHTAVRLSNFDVVNELVSSGVNVTAPGFGGLTVLDSLAMRTEGGLFGEPPHRPNDCRRILERLIGFFPPEYISTAESLAQTVASRGNPAVAAAFAETGLRFSRVPPYRGFDSLLAFALCTHHFQIIDMVLETPGHTLYNIVDLLFNPLYNPRIGPREESIDSFLFILSHLAEVGIIEEWETTTCLIQLIRTYDGVQPEGLARIFLNCGADRYFITSDSMYDAIALSAMHGKSGLLEILLHDRPTPDSPGHWLEPFDFVRQSSPDDASAVFSCMKKAGLLEPVEFPDMVDVTASPLFIAAVKGDEKTISALIAAGVDIETETHYGWRVLHYATWLGHERVVDVLLKADADVNAAMRTWSVLVDGDGLDDQAMAHTRPWAGRPLHLAALQGYASIAQKLLARGANVHADTLTHPLDTSRSLPFYGPTALHIALDPSDYSPPNGRRGRKGLTSGHLAVAQVLVNHGADIKDVASHLTTEHVLKFEGFATLWDTLRAGMGHHTI